MDNKLVLISKISPEQNYQIEMTLNLAKTLSSKVDFLHCLCGRESKKSLNLLSKWFYHGRLREVEKRFIDQGIAFRGDLVDKKNLSQFLYGLQTDERYLIILGEQERSLVHDFMDGYPFWHKEARFHFPLLYLKHLKNFNPVQNVLEKIVFPVDFSKNAYEILEYLLHIKEGVIQEIHLIHIQDLTRNNPEAPKTIDERNQKDQQKLDDIGIQLRKYGIQKIVKKILIGHPVEEIMAYANDLNIPLIILGQSGKGQTESVITGSVTRQLMVHSKSSILMIPPQK